MTITVTQLWRYPVKSLQGESLAQAHLGPEGIPGDRLWAVCDAANNRPVSAKQAPVLMTLSARFSKEPEGGNPGQVVLTSTGGDRVFDSEDPEVDCQLSDYFNHLVTLRASDRRGFFDDAPLHLLSHQSLASMHKHSQSQGRGQGQGTCDFDARRFRANIIVDIDSATSPWPEQAWSFHSATIGEVVLKIAAGTERCAMTTMPFADLPADAGILKTTMQTTRGVLGVYASTEQPGVIHPGDIIVIQ